MKGFVRPLLIGLGTVAAALLAAGAWFALGFDPNAYRDEIAGLVRTQTGRELVIEGDLSITWFPSLGFEVGAAHLAQPAGVGGAPFASLDGAAARVRLLPLLHHRIEIGHLRLDGLAVELERRADGTTNWDDLSRLARDLAVIGRDSRGAESLSVRALEIAGARLHYVDRQAQSEYTLRDGSLTTGALVSGAPFAVDAQFRLENGELAAEVKASAEAVVSTERGALELRDPAIALKLTGAAVPVAELALQLRGAVARYAGAELSVDAPRVTISGRAARDVRIDGTLSAQSSTLARADALALAAPLLDLVFAGEAVPGGRAELTAHAPSLATDLKAQTLALDELAGELYGLAFRISATGTQIVAAPQLVGTFELSGFSPKELLRSLGQEEYVTADPAALTRAELSAAYTLSATALRLSDVRMKLDDTALTGELSVGDFDTRAVRFDLQADRMTLDRYLAAAEAASADPNVQGGLSSDTLRALDVEGTLKIAEMQLAGIRSTDVELALRGH